MERRWTEHQLDAIEARGGSVIVSAAAGSGKTAVLVERVIRLITDSENGTDADRLLVVTYTRKAAAELKVRLKEALAERLRADPSNAFLIRQQSLLSKAHISTVDAFCMSLCKEYSYLLDIDRNIRIADSGELSVIRNDAMRLTLDLLYAEKDPKFHRLVETFASARDDSRLEDNIFQLYDFLRSHPFPERWLNEKLSYYTDFTDVADTVWGSIIAEYAREAADYLNVLNERAIDAISLDEKLHQAMFPLFDTYRLFTERLHDAVAHKGWDDIRAVLLSFDAGRLSTPRGYADNPLKLAAASARDVFKNTVKTLQKCYAQEASMCLYEIERLKDYTEQIFKAVTLFEKHYALLKREHGVADYADIEHWVLSLIVDRETTAPTIVAQEIRSRFDYIMVDEYQDANEVQDTIFKTVSRDETNLFVVGDVKQSIYGFRQAMPELFLKRKNNATLYHRESPVFPAKIILEKNFRSDSGILSAVNFFFRKLMSTAVGDIEYNEEEQLFPGATYAPQKEPAAELVIIDKEAVGEEDAAVAEACYIALRIRQMIDEGYSVKDGDRYRPVTISDFAVLMRNLSSYGAVYREVFELYGVPAHSESSAGFLGAREIMLMTNLLRVINNPALDIELLSVVMSPVFAFDEDDLARIRIGQRKGSLFAAITLDAEQGNQKSRAFLQELAYYRGLSATMPLYRLITVIFERSSFMAIVSASDSTGAAVGNLRLLLDYARTFEQNTRRGLSAFVTYLDRLTEDGSDLPSAVRDSGGDFGVELMTVHASKGLEFPVCFLANTARRFVSDTSRSVLLHSRYGYAQKLYDPALSANFNTMPRSALAMEKSRDEMSEELRVLYVAMTRAKQRLIMLATPSRSAVSAIQTAAKKLAGQREISPFAVRSASSLSDWLMMCALLHPDGAPLRDYAGVEADYEPRAEFHLRCQVIDKPFDALDQDEPVRELLTTPGDTSVTDILKQHVAFRYPYEALGALPVKVAASELAHRMTEERYDRHLDRPAFLQGETLTAAEKGTALHAFMQYVDFSAAREDIRRQLEQLTADGYLSEAQSKVVDLDRARRFLDSDTVTRCLNAEAVYKEYRFNVKLPAWRIDPEIDTAFREEEVILQGAVDLAFVENGELVIVDYKTDRVKAPKILAERYAAQLMLYKDAMEACLGHPVKECLIYSIYQSSAVKVYQK
ncbi:helicase-exonuclease AddAB subunit AddA [Ruminococcus sp.]|uniref:helicase-exonuclease AddAB subunit AddA n=1 Tax=Ruminococcus sp. TaxID=41978 RepID=UPI0038908F97